MQIDGGIPEFGQIDSLLYTYNDERLQSVSDLLDSTTLAQPKGFGPVFSGYDYDGNGNLTGDDGKGLAIHYNLLNLPDSITDQTDFIWLDYTFGGQKIRKELSGGEERFYLGGLEVVDGGFEAFHHPEGRAVWCNDTLRFQYKLTDHLGNTVVLFEDKNLDTQILTEEMTEDTLLLEVLQRNYYYPFGMEMEGLWDPKTGPGMRYLYNGKEWDEDLGLGWYDYGFRYYAPDIGRFTGVDPLADLAPGWTPYRYGFNNPVLFIDPFGLFETKREARKYRRENTSLGRRNSSIKKNKGGTYDIRDDESHMAITKTSGGEIEYSATASAYGLRQNEAGFWEQQANGNAGQQIVHGIADALYVTAQDLNPLDTEITHLEGGEATRGERQDAFVESVATLMPISAVKGASAAKSSKRFTKSSLQFGQQMHNGYKAGLADNFTTFKEFRGIKGIRPDFVDFNTRTIYELKPYNPRAMQHGWNQLNRYKTLFDKHYPNPGSPWRIVLDTY